MEGKSQAKRCEQAWRKASPTGTGDRGSMRDAIMRKRSHALGPAPTKSSVIVVRKLLLQLRSVKYTNNEGGEVIINRKRNQIGK